MKKMNKILMGFGLLVGLFLTACGDQNLTINPLELAVTLQSPVTGATVPSSFTVSGIITSPQELNLLTVYYSFDGSGSTNLVYRNITGKSNVNFSKTLNMSQSGSFKLWVEVIDIKGNMATSDIYSLSLSTVPVSSVSSMSSEEANFSSVNSSLSQSVSSQSSSQSVSNQNSVFSSSVSSSSSFSVSSVTSSSFSSMRSSSSFSSQSFSSSSESGITVYVEKPDTWSSVYIWFDENSDDVWETTTLGQAPGNMTEYRTGWFKKNFPVATTLTFLFNDGTWNNKWNTAGFNQNGSDFVATSSVWFSKDGSQSSTDPLLPQSPSFTVTPSSTTFTSDVLSINVSVNGENINVAKYSLDGGDPASTGTSFSSSTVISVGSGLSVGQSQTLIIYASNSVGSTWTTNVYQKIAPITNSSDFRDLRIYQIMVSSFQDGDPNIGYNDGYGPGSFNGDLQGVYDSLSYIKSMGFNAIWMTPIFDSTSGGDYRLNSTGYFANNYFSVDPNFGTWQKLQDVVTHAHELGLYVLLDGVFGHHNGNNIQASPSGYYPQGGNDPVSYPGSLDFYKEVATFWIEQMGIDGWRLDQAYQVNSNPSGDTTDGQSYWKDIREAVEQVCATRKAAGEQWGTLGYMVGEIWKGENIINAKGYGNDGLRSCFDFPLRYRVVQALAEEESGASGDATAIESGYQTHSVYPTNAFPNFFISNHDLVRFGDLVQRKYGYGRENADYWKRHKAAFSFMASYSGPITVYYGDELGEEVANDQSYYQDNVARNRIDINNLDANETDLTNYVGSVMRLKVQYPALSRGSRQNLVSTTTIHADLKTDGSQKIVYILNTSTSSETVQINGVGGSQLRDLLTGEVISGGGTYSVTAPALSGRFLIVE